MLLNLKLCLIEDGVSGFPHIVAILPSAHLCVLSIKWGGVDILFPNPYVLRSSDSWLTMPSHFPLHVLRSATLFTRQIIQYTQPAISKDSDLCLHFIVVVLDPLRNIAGDSLFFTNENLPSICLLATGFQPTKR